MINPSCFFRPPVGLPMGHMVRATVGASSFLMLRQATAW